MNMEQLAKQWGTLYRNRGYSHYAMSKFEEYELYLRNKDFLISDRVLTFTDTDGKLMALKPDVTLSIIKNTDDSVSGVQKLYYQENVYRPGKNQQGFREIMQVGLECIGNVDTYCVFEVLYLAAKSLEQIGKRWVLDISHMGLLAHLLDKSGLTGNERSNVIKAISEKNAHEVRKICQAAGIDPTELARIADLSGSAFAVMPELEQIFADAPELQGLKLLTNALADAGVDSINIDFSVINDMNYYNGIVFRGFVEGVPERVLSGGQYDGMMQKMRRKNKAIGFALYPDLLERLLPAEAATSADAVLLYSADTALSQIEKAVTELTGKGMCVNTQPAGGEIPRGCKVFQLDGNEVKCVENNA